MFVGADNYLKGTKIILSVGSFIKYEHDMVDTAWPQSKMQGSSPKILQS